MAVFTRSVTSIEKDPSQLAPRRPELSSSADDTLRSEDLHWRSFLSDQELLARDNYKSSVQVSLSLTSLE